MDTLEVKRVTLLTKESASGAVSEPINVEGYTHIAMYIIPNGTVTSGAVTYEEATYDPAKSNMPYGDPTKWAAIGSAVSPTSAAGISATHLTVAGYSLVHARISTVIGGTGTVTVVMVAVP